MNHKYSGASEEENALVEELRAYRKDGCELLLEGRPARPERVASNVLRERHDYMRDFVSDEDQRIRKINFIRIRQR